MNSCWKIFVCLLVLTFGLPTTHAQLTAEELQAAEDGTLPLVSPEALPALAQFYSWQRPGQPPLPFNLAFGLDVYELSAGRYLSDDRLMDYAATARSETSASLMSAGGFGVENAMSTAAYGCALWLQIARVTNSASNVVVTLHNTVGGGSYHLWSKERLVVTQAWTMETNLTGASGQDWTTTTVPMNGRSNLFFLAGSAAYFTNKSFAGIQYSNSLAGNPDAMGAVGPEHFLEIVNGSDAVAVYDKCSGELVQRTNTLAFFAVTANGTNYPTLSITDPRVLYDHQAQRWIACVFDTGSRNVILAVSKDSRPVDLLTNWTKFLLPLARSGAGTDFPTLGVDQNGIYLSVLQLVSGQIASNIVVAIKKPEIYQGTNLSIIANVPTNDVFGIIQPAVNFDAAPHGGYAWFVAKQPRTNASPYLGGAVAYRRMQWSGTNASWADTNWVALTNTSYRDYFDLDDGDVRAPQTNGSPALRLNQTGSRLMMAVIRDGALWTCHHVGLSGTNGTYTGDATGTNVDRSGVQWLKLTTDTNGHYLAITNGRFFDTNSIAPYWYYFPSLIVNKAGDMVAGFSGSRSNGYIGAFYSYRAAGGTNDNQLRVLQTGKGLFNSNRWGDYSYTSLDPLDGLSFWTVQQYAEDDPLDNQWGTWISEILPTAAGP